ncbi:MAG: VWA domain-containing protein [Myxococcaceae bacterium]
MSGNLGRLCLGLFVAGAALSCGNPPTRQSTTQTKTVVAHQLVPNVMILVDRSGAMTTNTSVAAPCPGTIGACGPGNPCPSGCNTRIDDVKTSLDSMLGVNGPQLRVGVSYFPSDSACGAANANTMLVPLLPPALSDDTLQNQAQANAATVAISGLVPQGGMPTAESLRFLASQPELSDVNRENFVMLFTSGAPDCNSTPGDAVAAATELSAKKIRTIVMAIGADALSATDVDALNRLAVAGDFARACPLGTDAECGSGDTCDQTQRLCNHAFFGASDAQQLTQQLLQMTQQTAVSDQICTAQLTRATPADVEHLEVTVNNLPFAACASATNCNTWTYDAGTNSVVFHGLLCDEIKNATQAQPAQLAFTVTSG